MIDDRSIQRFLQAQGFYKGLIDDDFGKQSVLAARAFLQSRPAGTTSYAAAWPAPRVMVAVEQAIMESIGQDLGVIDGVAGPRTQIALERWQDHITFDRPAIASSPVGGATKWPRHGEALAFYGEPGTNHTTIEPPYPVFYGSQLVKRITINKKCSASALRILNAVKAHYGEAEIHRLGLDRYGGCYNNRVMRNGTRLSTHAFAAAWDWDAPRNPLRATRATAQFAKPAYAAFIDAHEAEGWVSLGRARDFDWMHFQAVRL